MRSKIVDPYNKIVARTTQLARLQVRSSSLSSSPYQLGVGGGGRGEDWEDWGVRWASVPLLTVPSRRFFLKVP